MHVAAAAALEAEADHEERARVGQEKSREREGGGDTPRKKPDARPMTAPGGGSGSASAASSSLGVVPYPHAHAESQLGSGATPHAGSHLGSTLHSPGRAPSAQAQTGRTLLSRIGSVKRWVGGGGSGAGGGGGSRGDGGRGGDGSGSGSGSAVGRTYLVGGRARGMSAGAEGVRGGGKFFSFFVFAFFVSLLWGGAVHCDVFVLSSSAVFPFPRFCFVRVIRLALTPICSSDRRTTQLAPVLARRPKLSPRRGWPACAAPCVVPLFLRDARRWKPCLHARHASVSVRLSACAAPRAGGVACGVERRCWCG